MPFDLLPALLLIAAIAVIVVVIRRRAVVGRARRSAATTTQPGPGSPGRVRPVVDQSIGMYLVRRMRGMPGASEGTVDGRRGSDVALRAAPPTRLTIVEGPRRSPARSSRASQTPDPDLRVRLWRDTAIVAVAIGFIAILGTTVLRPNVDGGVLGQVFPAIETPDPNATAIALPPTPPAETQTPAASDQPQSPDPSLAPAASRAPSPTSPPKPAPTGSPTPASTPDQTPTPDPTSDPTPAPTPDPTPTPEPTPEPTPDPTPAPTPDATPAPDPTPDPPPVP